MNKEARAKYTFFLYAWVQSNEPEVTKFGHWSRKSSTRSIQNLLKVLKCGTFSTFRCYFLQPESRTKAKQSPLWSLSQDSLVWNDVPVGMKMSFNNTYINALKKAWILTEALAWLMWICPLLANAAHCLVFANCLSQACPWQTSRFSFPHSTHCLHQ